MTEGGLPTQQNAEHFDVRKTRGRSDVFVMGA